MNYKEFAKKIKNKYPEYTEIDDLELAERIIEKYPVYSDTVTFEKIQDFREPPAQNLEGMQKAINIASKVAPYAGIALKTNPIGMLGSAALTGGSRFVEGKTEGESNLQALKNAAMAAGIDLGTLGLGKVLGKGIRSAPVSKAIGQAGEFLSSVPQKSITKAVQDPSILTKTETFEDVGQSAKDALSRQMTKVGQRAKREKNILKRSDVETDLSTFAKRQEALLDRRIGKQPKYNSKEKKVIQEVLNNLKNDTTPAGINDIISRIDESIKWDAINKPSSRVEKVLKTIRNKASNTLKKNIDEYKTSRKQQEEFLKEANKVLGKRLTDTKDASKLFKRQQEQPVREALEKLDELDPQSRLLDRAENLRAQQQFSNIFPGQGGGSGGAQGISNIIRAITGTNAPPLLPLMSPLGQREIIKRTPSAMKAASKFLSGSTVFTPIKRNQDGSYTEESKKTLQEDKK